MLVKFLEGRAGKEGKNQFMPPGKRKKLEPAELALVKAWIDGGAVAPKDPAKAIAREMVIPKIIPIVAPLTMSPGDGCTSLMKSSRSSQSHPMR